MNKEQLLMPRFKVIANYPGSPYKVGKIITLNKIYGTSPAALISAYAGNAETHYWPLHEFEKYPAIFQRLEWWEERAIENLPQYCKVTEKAVYDMGAGVHQISHYRIDDKYEYAYLKSNGWPVPVQWFEPSDEAEYLAYKASLPVAMKGTVILYLNKKL